MNASRLGPYVLEKEIGRGGMGVVYRARHPERGLVAIKTFDREVQDPRLAKRFRREGRILARLEHPNVCRVLEVGERDGRVFITMELLEGESLAQVLRRGPVPLRKAVSTARDVLSALSAVHKLGIVHRDIKPSNVLLTSDMTKVVDFGLAKPTSAGPGEATASEVTQAGRIVGTPCYMSPEQIRDEAVDERSDLFSVGAMLFEMIAGRRAFAGRAPLEVTHSILENEPPALGGSPAVAVVDRVIRKAVEKKPGARYASAAEMSAALEEAIRACGDDDAPTSFAVTRLIVLPFRVTPPDPEREPLARAVPDGITNAISSLDSVVVRSPSLARKVAEGDPDLQAIAREADVDVVLTGSMLSAGHRVRVDCQLVRVPEGTVEWAHKTYVQAADFIELLDGIVDRVVGSLALSLTKREQKMLRRELPGNPAAFECFVRANLQLGPQLLGDGEKLEVAIQLLRRATEEDPEYAHAWARLARCYWVRAKTHDRNANRAHARECLERAFSLSADLPLAHQVAALTEIDCGEAKKAMVRLVQRLSWGGAHPELFAALVQASRYCGLLEASAAAHHRLRQLDRNLPSSGYQTYWRLGQHERAMAEARQALYYEAYHLGVVQGDANGAIGLLRQREASTVPMIRSLFATTRTLLEGDGAACVTNAESVIDGFSDPEAMFLGVRHVAYFGDPGRVITLLERVLDGGYNWFRTVRAPDPWLEKLFDVPAFLALEERARSDYKQARAEFYAAGGGSLFGVDLPEDAIATGRP